MKRFLLFIAAISLTFGTLRAQTPGQAGGDAAVMPGSDTASVIPGSDRASVDTTRFVPDESIAFAQYDTLTLEMDLYFPTDDAEQHRCIIYTYGGGFIDNNQRHIETRALCRRLADDGFVVVATNYRLGLRGAWPAPLPEGVAALERGGAVLLANLCGEDRPLTLPRPLTDLLTGAPVPAVLPANGCAVVRKEELPVD